MRETVWRFLRDEDAVRIEASVSEVQSAEAETPSRPLRIFLNYRRADSRFHTEQLHGMLVDRFGDENVFWDIDTIDLGVDFVEAINDSVGSCDVLVAVVGKAWSSITDEGGSRRLENPEDYVRLEIEAALSRRVRVIPACVQGAAIPRSTELPESLRPLARRNGIELRDGDFRPDVERLISRLEDMERVLVEKERGAASAAREREEREKAEPERDEREQQEENERLEREASERAELERLEHEAAEQTSHAKADGAAREREAHASRRTQFAVGSVVLSAVLTVINMISPGFPWWAPPVVVTSAIAAAIVLFWLVVPRIKDFGRWALILAILGAVTLAVSWTGLPPVFAGAAALLGLEARERRVKLGLATTALALVAVTVVGAAVIAFVLAFTAS
jgi:hypothetical protein